MRLHFFRGLPLIVACTLVPIACTSVLGDFTIGSGGPTNEDAGDAGGDVNATGETGPNEGGPLPCPAPQTRCSDGTCRDTPTDVNHCGPSCQVCPTVMNATPSCVAGACKAPCDATFTACGAACVDVTGDSRNCGACGHDCKGGLCTTSMCKPLLFVGSAATGQVNDLATDGTVLVWADGTGSINQVSTPGGAKIVLSTAVNPRAVAIFGTKVEWMEFSGGTTSSQGGATVGTAASGSLLTPTIGGVTNGLLFNAGGTKVFTTQFVTPNVYLLACADTGGCTSSTSVPSLKSSFNLALDPANTYAVFSDITNAKVVMFRLSNSVVSFVTGQAGATWVASDTSNAYWANNGTSPTPIMSAALGSTTATAILTNTGGAINGIATDGTYVYYATGTDILRIPVAGPATVTPTRLVASLNAFHLKYVSGALYYDDSGNIYRLATP